MNFRVGKEGGREDGTEYKRDHGKHIRTKARIMCQKRMVMANLLHTKQSIKTNQKHRSEVSQFGENRKCKTEGKSICE